MDLTLFESKLNQLKSKTLFLDEELNDVISIIQEFVENFDEAHPEAANIERLASVINTPWVSAMQLKHKFDSIGRSVTVPALKKITTAKPYINMEKLADSYI